MSNVLITIRLPNYRAPDLYQMLLIQEAEYEKFLDGLECFPRRQIVMGEVAGKHSEMVYSVEEILEGITTSREPEKIAAFDVLATGDNERDINIQSFDVFGRIWDLILQYSPDMLPTEEK